MNIESLEVELVILKHELHQLRVGNQKQENRIDQLIHENRTLALENQKLQTKLNQLEDKLNINSSNSGLPTSKDIYRIERKFRPKSSLKPGEQARVKTKRVSI